MQVSTSQNCVGELAGGGGSCRISVGVSPVAARTGKGTPISGMLEIADDAAGSPHKVRLSAIVVAAGDPAPAPTPTPAPADPLAAQILVANSTCNTVTSYAIGAAGNAAPIVAQTGLCNPTGIALDSNGNIYVTNTGNQNEPSYSVTVYPVGTKGNQPPSATISGSSTGLVNPSAIAVDANENIYVANDGSDFGGTVTVTIYPAGSNGNVAPSATISGTNTGLNGPTGIAVDGSGNIYVANRDSNTVTVYPAGSTGNAAPSKTIGGYKTGLNDPSGIAADSNGQIYVTNDGSNSGGSDSVTIYAAGSNGNAGPKGVIGGSNTELVSPMGIAVNGSGIYVANVGNNTVTLYGVNNGNVAPSATIDDSFFPAGIVAPVGIALDHSGSIYVANQGGFNFDTDVSNAATVTVYPAGSNSEAGPSATISGSNTGLNDPAGIAVDSGGNIYVANNNSNTVTVYIAGSDNNAQPTATIGGSNTTLNSPVGIAVDGGRNIYVVGSNAVTVYPPVGSSTGTLNESPTATIGGTNTGLNIFQGIAVDGSGNIYVANAGRKFGSLDAVIVYPAGSVGNVTPSATITGPGTGLNAPFGIALDGSRNIYVANFSGTATVYPPVGSSTGTLNETPTATIGGTSSGLNDPLGIALDGNRNIYVTNDGSDKGASDTVTVYPAGTNNDVVPLATIGGSNTTLDLPVGVALDSSGNIYVTNDGSNNGGSDTLAVYPEGSHASGAPITTISGGLSTPAGIALDSSRNIYVANQGNDTVTVYSSLGNGTVLLATIYGDSSGLNAPTGIALDGSGNIYVTNNGGSGKGYDTSSDTVTVYAAQSNGHVAPSATIAGSNTGLGYPSGVAIDGSGNIYVANKATDTVTIYPPGSNGNVAPSATIGGSNTGLDAPAGIAVDASGNIYVTNAGGFDGDNASVTVYPPGSNGNVAPGVTIAGPATQLARPQGIAVVP